MSGFDYGAQAELFPARGRGFRRQEVSYKRFNSAADAIRFAVETLPSALLIGAILEVDEERYDHVAIKELYERVDYPLARGALPAPQPAPLEKQKSRSDNAKDL